MSSPLRIANCSGFYGDRLSAAREMVEGGPIDVLTGDWLAELTMLILARTALKHPGGGYARSFVTQMEQVMGTCLDRGIKVVANAGGLSPDSCANAVADVADKLGLSPTIAYVDGDNILSRLGEFADRGVGIRHFETGEEIPIPGNFLTANAYFGCFGIVEALTRGADIVITGRVTDAAVVCGPAAWHHGWSRTDYDALAGAVVAGHVIECGAQATGGNYSFFTEIDRMTHVGFPWAEIASDGSAVIGKHDGTDGQVSIGTVTSQLLYEISGPRYFGPDVTARFDTLSMEDVAPDRVRISGVRGEAPPPTLKVAMNEIGGFRKDLSVALTGLDIDAKAALVEGAFWDACPYSPGDFASVTTRVLRTDKVDPSSNEEAVAIWRITLKDPDERKVGRAVANAATEIALATIPGFFGIGGMPSGGSAFGVYRPATIERDLVPQYVHVVGGETTVVDSLAETGPSVNISGLEIGPPARDWGPTTPTPLGRLVGARSGDKGGHANLGVFARSASAYAWIDEFLTTQRIRELLPETAGLTVDRYSFENFHSLNFVIHDLLQEGVAASTRQDAQAKGLGEWLRARIVEIPDSLLKELP